MPVPEPENELEKQILAELIKQKKNEFIEKLTVYKTDTEEKQKNQGIHFRAQSDLEAKIKIADNTMKLLEPYPITIEKILRVTDKIEEKRKENKIATGSEWFHRPGRLNTILIELKSSLLAQIPEHGLSLHNLNQYLKKTAAEGKTKYIGNPPKSNRSDKYEIAGRILKYLANPESIPIKSTLEKELEKAIKQNKTATKSLILHGAGKLHMILEQILQDIKAKAFEQRQRPSI